MEIVFKIECVLLFGIIYNFFHFLARFFIFL